MVGISISIIGVQLHSRQAVTLFWPNDGSCPRLHTHVLGTTGHVAGVLNVLGAGSVVEAMVEGCWLSAGVGGGDGDCVVAPSMVALIMMQSHSRQDVIALVI